MCVGTPKYLHALRRLSYRGVPLYVADPAHFRGQCAGVGVSRAVRFPSPYFCPQSHLQSSPGQWDIEMLLAHGLIFEPVLPKMAIMFVTLIATYLRGFKWKFEELTSIL